MLLPGIGLCRITVKSGQLFLHERSIDYIPAHFYNSIDYRDLKPIYLFVHLRCYVQKVLSGVRNSYVQNIAPRLTPHIACKNYVCLAIHNWNKCLVNSVLYSLTTIIICDHNLASSIKTHTYTISNLFISNHSCMLEVST